MSKQSAFIIMVDALRYDYVTEAGMPFLFSLQEKGIYANVVETFAFQTRPAYFAGLEPEQSDICHLFRYDPEESPFHFLKPYELVLKCIDKVGLDRFLRGIIRRTAKRGELERGYEASAQVLSTERIPLHLLPFFRLSEREHTDSSHSLGVHQTIFDLLREAGKTWNWIGYPRHYGSSYSILSTFHKSPPADVTYLHFSDLDWVGHKYGPDSVELEVALLKMDSILRVILQGAVSEGARAVIFGDHGMVKVTYQIDLLSRLSELPYTNGKEYLVFIDSTQARFWFFNDSAKNDIVELLSSIDGGHVLTEAERKQLRIRFSHRGYGDVIFMLDGAGIIHPSYFSRTGSGPLGMHGYLPHVKENMSYLAAVGSSSSAEDLGTIPMRKIFAILREVLGV